MHSENKVCETCAHWVRESAIMTYSAMIANCDILDDDAFMYPQKWTCGQWEARTRTVMSNAK